MGNSNKDRSKEVTKKWWSDTALPFYIIFDVAYKPQTSFDD